MKKLWTLLLAVMMLVLGVVPAGAAGASDRFVEVPGYDTVEVPTDVISYESDIVMTYIQEFANFTQIPRRSHHVEKMTAYLAAWAEAHGVAYETEECGNVIMYLDATEGYEDKPVVSFQCHIDMVAATDEGVEHDWANDPLTLIWSENQLTADGTSLGADNGSGIAFVLTYIDYADQYAHGPIVMLFTVDEEDGCLGAHAMDPKYVENVKYLVNVDGGYGGAIISCAGGKYFTFTHDAEYVATPDDAVLYALEVKGLKGGHSAGVGGGKANGLVVMSDAMLALNQAGVAFSIATFEGGSATNAIPGAAKAVIAVSKDDVDAADAAMDAFAKLFKQQFEATEPNYELTYGVTDATAEKVLDADLSVKLVSLMSVIPNNIHTLLATASGTESSSNLGLLSVSEEGLSFTAFMRSSSNFQAEQITMINTSLAQAYGFQLDIPMTLATWPLKANNALSEIAASLFKELTGNDYRLSAIHAGVECGEFAVKNEDLYIISTGISGGSAGHTTAEAMNFDMVEVSFDFLVKLATRLVEAE